MSYLTEEAVSAAELSAELLRASDGAVVTFEGVVRNHNDGKAVESITYEAYGPMAEKEFAKIVDEIRAAHPDVVVACRHRFGLLRVGDVSIAIAAASPHRAEAFAACRMLIDRIKQTVPIWKKERGPDGEEWIGWQCDHGAQEDER